MMAFGGFTRPPTRMGADFPGVGGNGLAPVAQHSTKYAANHATHLSAGHASWHAVGHTTEAVWFNGRLFDFSNLLGNDRWREEFAGDQPCARRAGPVTH